MSNWRWLFIPVTLLLGVFSFESCQKDEVSPFKLVSIQVGNIDLSTTSPTGVPVAAVINAHFSTGIDPATVRAGISLIRNYDSAASTLTLIVTQGTITIRSTSNLTPGTNYTLSINSGLHSSKGTPFTSFTASFKTEGAFVPPGQIAYWNFEGIADDVLGSYDPVANGSTLTFNSYVDGRNVAAGQAAQFNGTSDIVEIANGSALLGKTFSISLWVKLITAGHTDVGGNPKGNYVVGIGNEHGFALEVDPLYRWIKVSHGVVMKNDSTAVSVFQFSGSGITHNDLSGQPDSIRLGIDNATTINQNLGQSGLSTLLDNTWAHVAFTFDGDLKQRSLYINGVVMYRQDFSLLDTLALPHAVGKFFNTTGMKYIADVGLPPLWDGNLAFGFWQSRGSEFLPAYNNTDAWHLKGLLDDIRVFSRSLTDLEIATLYQDEKP